MLDELRRRIDGKRLTIVGVGNPLRGDDGVGVALVERLQGQTSATLVNASDVPENYLGVIESARPQVVVMVDAVNLGAQPGDVAFLEIEQLARTRVSTHNASLALFAEVLRQSTGADILVLGIQPSTLAFGAPLSAPVQAALEKLTQVF